MEDQQIISTDGYEKLKQEFDYLTKIKRHEIARRIELAKELGDLSENAEYHDAKEAQAFNEGRVAELESLLKNLTVVNNHEKGEFAGIGSMVTVQINGRTKQYNIVSFNEANPAEGKISNESPLGSAFLNKRKGDCVKVNTPNGQLECKIITIE